jgi:hypothetical protein
MIAFIARRMVRAPRFGESKNGAADASWAIARTNHEKNLSEKLGSNGATRFSFDVIFAEWFMSLVLREI